MPPEPHTSSSASQREERSEKTRQRSDRKAKHEWEAIRKPFEQLYVVEDRSLKDSLDRLRADHGFDATQNQMKFMVKKWGIEKKVKGSEMRHIIEIQKWHKTQNPLEQTRFVVRGRPVTEAKIERYKRTYSIPSDQPTEETPSAVWGLTPSATTMSQSRRPRRPHYPAPGSHLMSGADMPTPLPMAPSMRAFNWWSLYGASYVRKSAPTPHGIPLWQILGQFIIKGDTFEEEMYNRKMAEQFRTARTEILSQNLISYGGSIEGSVSCAYKCSKHYRILYRQKNIPVVQVMRVADTACNKCRIDDILRLYYTWESAYVGGSQSLSHAPNRAWCVSEVLKLAMLSTQSRAASMSVAVPFCVSEILQNDPDLVCAVVLDYCKQEVDDVLPKLIVAVLISFFLIFAGLVSHSARLLEAIVLDQAPDLTKAPTSPYFILPTTTYVGGLSVVMRRFLAAAHNTALWWHFHPLARDRVFNSSPRRVMGSSCLGTTLNDYHFCFNGTCQTNLSRHAHPKVLSSDEDLNLQELLYLENRTSPDEDHRQVHTQVMWRLQQKWGYLLEQEIDETAWEESLDSPVADLPPESTKTLEELLI